jgi:arsenate reductase-like glutaredoxin family protein
MGIQIFGTLKCQDTRKAQRYFKDRGIPFQFVNLAEKGLSRGELNSIKAIVGVENLIDKNSKEYNKRNLKYLAHNVEEELLNHPLLYRTPIVRGGRKATVGYAPDLWKEWT